MPTICANSGNVREVIRFNCHTVKPEKWVYRNTTPATRPPKIQPAGRCFNINSVDQLRHTRAVAYEHVYSLEAEQRTKILILKTTKYLFSRTLTHANMIFTTPMSQVRDHGFTV